MYEVYFFCQARQHEKETLAQFETRLRKLAATYEFTDTEGEIKNHIIQQCTNSRIRCRALHEPTWKLADILDFGRSFETGNTQATEIEMSLNSMSLQDSHKAKVNKVQIKKRKWPKRETQSNRQLKQTTQSACNNCGLPYHKNGTCLARGQTCKACNKKNHYAHCCHSVKMQTKQNAQPGRINQVQTVPDLEDSSLEDSSSDELSDEYVYTVNGASNSDTPSTTPQVDIKVQNTMIQFLIGSGVTVNLIDEEAWSKIRKRNKSIMLQKSTSRIYPYGSDKPLKVKGLFTTTLESKTRFMPAVIQVAKGKAGNLLNCHTACELGLIRLHVNHIDNEPAGTPQAPPYTITPSQPAQQINPDSPTFIQDVLHKYRNIWKDGRIGKLKDFEVKLHVDPSVQPVIQLQQRIPFHLHQKVDAELDKLEKQGIIEPVTGPTTWVSPIVVIPKPNSDDVRICVDMRSPNKCIKQERHPMPTADELISSLHGANIFSKIDLNVGYNQLSLAEESRHLTTFSTHRGLCCYTHLNFGTNSAAEQFQQAIQQVSQVS